MLPNVFNDLFAEGERRKVLIPFSLLKFSVYWLYKKIFQVVYTYSVSFKE